MSHPTSTIVDPEELVTLAHGEMPAVGGSEMLSTAATALFPICVTVRRGLQAERPEVITGPEARTHPLATARPCRREHPSPRGTGCLPVPAKLAQVWHRSSPDFVITFVSQL